MVAWREESRVYRNLLLPHHYWGVEVRIPREYLERSRRGSLDDQRS